MPFAISEGARIFYRLEGVAEKPLLVLVHSLGVDHGLWDPQMPALLRYFQVSTRGPARPRRLRCSSGRLQHRATGPGCDRGYRFDSARTLRLLRAVAGRDDRPVAGSECRGSDHASGPGQHLAASRRPGVIRRTAQSGTRRWNGGRRKRRDGALLQPTRAGFAESAGGYFANRVACGESGGLCGLLRGGPRHGSTPAAWPHRRAHSGHRRFSGCRHALGGAWRFAGFHDPRSTLGGARSSAPLERRIAVGFHQRALRFPLLPPQSDDRLAAGFAMRRAILGDAHVDRAIANTTELTRDFQDLITRYAWGTVWTRPGLDPQVRRLLVLAITASLGRWEEFRLHLRAGLAGGLELADLEEVLLQVAIYAGVPAANTGFHIASEKEQVRL